jgi:hypothetical protein
MTRAGQRGAPAGKVAQAIWQAATDNSPRLRYVVGIDAKSLLALRALVSNRVYMGIVKSQLLK